MRNYNAAGNTRSRCACEPDAASDRQPEYVVAMAYVPGNTLKRPTNWIRHLKPEPYSQNLISRFWQWEGGGGGGGVQALLMNQMTQMNQAQLLHWINMVSFCCGGHYGVSGYASHRCEAICYFNHHIEMRRNAMQVYADKFGPLTIDTANPDAYWDWANSPCRGKEVAANVEL